MLTRKGLLIPSTPEIKKQLTVKPNDSSYGIQSPSFKIFREESQKRVYAPRYYGEETEDNRAEPTPIRCSFSGSLRDYQEEALVRFLETKSGGVLSMPCGFGKTCTSLAIAARIGLRVMIIVHKEFLANQWRENINRFCPGATIGLIQGDKEDLDKDFVICMIQTLCSREHRDDLFDSIGLLIVDECHHIGARAFSQTMFKLCPKYTLGLSATPNRKDGLESVLYMFLGPQFYLIETKHMDNVKVYKINYNPQDKSIPYNRIGKISLVDIITRLTNDISRNNMIYDMICHDRNILILTDRREHAKELHTNIKDSSLYIGGMKEQELLESSKSKVIIGTYSLAHEGLDIPSLDTVILATPHSDVKQAVGRIMRGAKDPIIYDIVDNIGPLYGMWNKRSKMYKESGFEGPWSECLIEGV
jgi:superfamily II DNA or RNA helicase